MPRPRAAEPLVTWKICIPQSLAARIELLLFDPITRKPTYGGRSELIRDLLEKFLSEQKDPSDGPK